MKKVNIKIQLISLIGAFLFFLPLSVKAPELPKHHHFLYSSDVTDVKEMKSSIVPYGSGELDSFLKAIEQVETAGGKYLTHSLITRGIHKGYRAIGFFAIMPLTAHKYISTSDDPELEKLKNLSVKEIEEAMLNSFELQVIIARGLALKYYKKFNKKPVLMAYAWYFGPHRPTDVKNAIAHFYVQRFLKHFIV